MTTPEQRLEEAADTPSMLDEKKYLEERRRQLEDSLHDHLLELRERGTQAGRVVLVGAAALVGVWALAKTVSTLRAGKKRKKARALKEHVQLTALGPGPEEPADRETPRPRAAAPRYQDPPPTRPRYEAPPAPAEPGLLQVFLSSESGRMMTNQIVALLMVFVTKKLAEVLQLDQSSDIGPVKESELACYRVSVREPEDATVVSADSGADSAARNPASDAAARPAAAPSA